MAKNTQPTDQERGVQTHTQKQPNSMLGAEEHVALLIVDTDPELNPRLGNEIESQPHGQQPQESNFNILPTEEQPEDQPFSIGKMLRNLPEKIPDPYIYRVPDSLRRLNASSFTPRMVAIGPFHRDNPALKPKEDLKLRFYQDLINRIPPSDYMCFLTYISKFIQNQESDIRCYYQENINLNSEDFCQMIMLDSVFILELLLKKEERHNMFANRWLFCDFLHDILLIENQIPLVITQEIYSRLGDIANGNNFTDLVCQFVKDVLDVSLDTTSYWKDVHFVHFFMAALVGIRKFERLSSSWTDADSKLFNRELILPWNFKVSTASNLFEYGVKFQKGDTTAPMDIDFQKKEGILTISQVKVNEWTETLFRNLVAFEQCHFVFPTYVSHYLIFMDGLIDIPEDVSILTAKDIIQDDFNDPQKVSEIFNNLHKEVIARGRHYIYSETSRGLHDYRRDLWHRFKAWWCKSKLSLKHDYFNSPWTIISFIAASVLLILTIVQTVCSIYQAKGITI